MRRRTDRRRRMFTFTQEFLDDMGIDTVRKMIIEYHKGYVGLPKTIRIGLNQDDFVYNQMTAIVQVMKVPRLLAPKRRRKNKISNRKLNRISHEKIDDRW